VKQAGLNDAYAGRWMEIDGRLESQQKVHQVGDIHVKSFRPVPGGPSTRCPVHAGPVRAEGRNPGASRADRSSANTRTHRRDSRLQKELPKTATSLPLFGLIGFVSLAAGLGLHLLNRRSLEQGEVARRTPCRRRLALRSAS